MNSTQNKVIGDQRASLLTLAGSPLGSVDMLGRHKVEALGLNLTNLTSEKAEAAARKAAASAFATIEDNNFKFKSLSSWAYNIALGCRHGCRFCYVPETQRAGPGKEKENTGPVATTLRAHGILDADAEWGNYVLLRPWDEKKFLASLKSAENTAPSELNPDGNRAVMLCSTTDPYQTLSVPEDLNKQKLLNGLRRHLVRRALELILEQSTLNVRILTRSPLAREDFDLYKKFGHRLLFGMSLPTLNDKLLRIYEPHAPAAKQRLETLQSAAREGIPVYVAVAPTYPECDEADLRATLKAIRPLQPVTVFHEPINIRAKNVQRIADQAAELGVTLRTEVFDDGPAWRQYAVEQLMTVERVAGELDLGGCLHLWPDKCLTSHTSFMEARQALFDAANPGLHETGYERDQRLAADEKAFKEFSGWLSHWHTRISEWPTATEGQQ
jgi:DNA repair photolyase